MMLLLTMLVCTTYAAATAHFQNAESQSVFNTRLARIKTNDCDPTEQISQLKELKTIDPSRYEKEALELENEARRNEEQEMERLLERCKRVETSHVDHIIATIWKSVLANWWNNHIFLKFYNNLKKELKKTTVDDVKEIRNIVFRELEETRFMKAERERAEKEEELEERRKQRLKQLKMEEKERLLPKASCLPDDLVEVRNLWKKFVEQFDLEELVLKNYNAVLEEWARWEKYGEEEWFLCFDNVLRKEILTKSSVIRQAEEVKRNKRKLDESRFILKPNKNLKGETWGPGKRNF